MTEYQESLKSVEDAINGIAATVTVAATDAPITIEAHTNADAIAEEASAIIKRAAGLVMDQIEESQKKLDDFRQHLINETVKAESSIKHTMLSIGAIGLAAVEFDKQVDMLVKGSQVLE